MKRLSVALRTAVLPPVALIVLLLAIPAAHAGIVITKSGKVFIGRIEPGDVKEKTLTVRHPRLHPGAQPAPGNQTFDRSEVRWFDEQVDEPTDPYFKQFLDEPLDTRWSAFTDRYRERMKNPPLVPDLIIKSRLNALPLTRTFHRCLVSIRRPNDWTESEAGGIVIFEAPDKRARIHVFASDLAGEKALAVARAALEKHGTRIDSTTETETGTSKAREWLTSIERKGRTTKALRHIVQTERSTAFAVAYADERDWSSKLSLVSESVETLVAQETK